MRELDVDARERYQIEVAAEEIFTNISSYAYKSCEGAAKVRVELDDNPLSVSISFIDGSVQLLLRLFILPCLIQLLSCQHGSFGRLCLY